MNASNNLVESPFGAPAAQPDTAGSRQLQQRESAETLAMVAMAKRFPRDVIANTDKILNAFTRPSLAERAQYQFSKGGSDVAGPSIRAAEAIAQMWGNLCFGFSEISRGIGYDGVPFSEVEAFCWDLESTNRQPLKFIVRHWRDTKRGGYKITDERDIYELVANQAQRRKRACILALIPGDVVEAAMAQADVTLRTKADTSPEAMTKMVDAFAAFGVTKEQIEKRIQRRLDAIQPAQVVQLKRIYTSLRDEMSTPADWFDPEGAGDDGAPAGGKPSVKMPTAKPPQQPAAAAGMPEPTPAPTPPTAAAAADPDTGELFRVPPGAQEVKPTREPAGTGVLATDGERSLILKRARTAGVEMAALLESAGVTGLPADLAGLTKDGFIALKDALPR